MLQIKEKAVVFYKKSNFNQAKMPKKAQNKTGI